MTMQAGTLVTAATVAALALTATGCGAKASHGSVSADPSAPVAIAPAKGAAWLSADSDQPRNRVYATWAVASTTDPHTKAYVAISRDGGETYAKPVWIARDDAAWQPVIRVAASGRLWATWTHFDLDPKHLLDPKDQYSNPGWQRVAFSDDGGTTWSAPVDVPRAGRVHTAFGTLAVTPDGRSVTAFWIDYLKGTGRDAARYLAATSHDGGKTFGPTAQIVRTGCVCCEPFGFTLDGRTALLFRGWEKATRSRDRRDIKLSHATTAGTWSPATSVHDDNFLLHHCPSVGPTATVDAGGVTHLAWWTGAQGRAGYWYATRDRAGSFSAPVLIERHPSAPSENNVTLARDGQGRLWTATVGHGEYTNAGKEDGSPNHVEVYAIGTDRVARRVASARVDGAFPQLVAARGDVAQIWISGGQIVARTLGVS